MFLKLVSVREPAARVRRVFGKFIKFVYTMCAAMTTNILLLEDNYRQEQNRRPLYSQFHDESVFDGVDNHRIFRRFSERFWTLSKRI